MSCMIPSSFPWPDINSLLNTRGHATADGNPRKTPGPSAARSSGRSMMSAQRPPSSSREPDARTRVSMHSDRPHIWRSPPSLSPDILRNKLNDALPADISILDIVRADPRFHARHHAVSRSYLYQICRRRTALGKRYVWWIKDPLNVSADAGPPESTSSECTISVRSRTTIRTKNPRKWRSRNSDRDAGDLILVRMRGSHFVWKMVRRVVGVLAEVGRGSMPGKRGTRAPA